METIQLVIAMGVVNYISMDTFVSEFVTTYGEVTLRPGQLAGKICHADTPASCATICVRYNSTCSMARYTATTRECVLYHWTAVGTVSIPRDPSEAIGTKVIIRQVDSHILVGELGARYNVSFQEAPSFCARVGGRVSSLAELTGARAIGWDFCSCSWLNDGFAYFWVFTADVSCGTTSLHKCSYAGRTIFDVHCTV